MSSLVVCSITPYPCVVCTQFADAHCCGCHHPRQCPFSVDFFLFLCIDNFFSANGVVVVGCVLLAPHTHMTHTQPRYMKYANWAQIRYSIHSVYGKCHSVSKPAYVHLLNSVLRERQHAPSRTTSHVAGCCCCCTYTIIHT